MPKFNNKTYIFTMIDEDSPNSVQISKSTNWEGLSISELLNMFRLFLLQVGYTEGTVRQIQDLTVLDVPEVPESELCISRFDE